jgi:hypothetical protein
LVGEKLQVFIAQYRGLQECPWGCDYEHRSSFDFLILNRKSGRYVTGPGLIVHLIRKHHFFEGLESPYRVDPTKVVQVLEIVPNNPFLSIPNLESRMRPGAMSHGGFLGPMESLEAVLTKDRHTLEEAQVTYDQVANALERVLQSALNQRDELLDQIARTPPKPDRMRTALEIALGSASASQQDSLYSEFEKRDLHMPDLSRPESVPRFSLDNLPDAATGYLVEGTLQVFFAGYRGLQDCPWDCTLIPWACFDFLILNRRSGEYIAGPGLIVHLIREHQFFEGSESPYRVEPLKAIRVLELSSDLREPSQRPTVLPNDQSQARGGPLHSSGTSLTVSHWPARLIGMVGTIVFVLFSALSIAANSPCGMVFFIPVTLACIPLALLYGRTSIDQWGITHSSPPGRYALDWDEINAVVMDIGENTIVFKGEGKQLVLPGFSFWAGRDKSAIRGLMDQELERRGIEISRGFAAFATSCHCRVEGAFGRGKGASTDHGALGSDSARDVALQPYLDRVATLIDEGLGESAADDPKRGLAQAWTRTAL